MATVHGPVPPRKMKRLLHRKAPTTPTPTPLTDLSKRVGEARRLILELLTELIGPVELDYDFYREWNGCWKTRVEISGAANGRLEFTLLQTADGALLALPRPLLERWRTETGIPAADGSRWSIDDGGHLVPFPNAACR